MKDTKLTWKTQCCVKIFVETDSITANAASPAEILVRANNAGPN